MSSLEENFERMANALETLARLSEHPGLQAFLNIKTTANAGDPVFDKAVKAAEETRKIRDTDEAEAKAKAKAMAAEAFKAAEVAAAAKEAAEAAEAAKAAKAAKVAKAAKAAAEAPSEPAEPKAKSGRTKDELRRALQAYREIEGTAAMLEILKKFGANSLADLAEDQYDAVFAIVG